MASTIEFYFDFLSPYAYLAHHKLMELANQYACVIDYRPINLIEAKVSVGNTGPSNREMPIKHSYLRLDLQRWASLYGVAFKPPAGYGSHRLNCGTFYAIDRDLATTYVQTAWHLVWGEGAAMDDDALLLKIAELMHWEPDGFLAYIKSDIAASRLMAMNKVAYGAGVFGVPTMRVDGHLWWGNDRLHFLEEYLIGATDNG